MHFDFLELAKKPASERVQEFEYRPGVFVSVTFAPADEQAERMGKAVSMRRGNVQVDDAKSRNYWCEHVTGWRGVKKKDGTEIPYSKENCHAWYDLDSDFRVWLADHASTVDRFLDPSSAA